LFIQQYRARKDLPGSACGEMPNTLALVMSRLGFTSIQHSRLGYLAEKVLSQAVCNCMKYLYIIIIIIIIT